MTPVAAGRVSPWNHVSVRHFPAVPASVSAARHHTVDVVQAWGTDELAETAALLVSELATNAMNASSLVGGPGKRGASDGWQGRVALRLTCIGTNLVVEVWDASDDPPVLAHTDFAAEHGRGLHIVEALSQQWGHYRPRTGGKVVWSALRVTLPPRSPAAGQGETPSPLRRRTPETLPHARAAVAIADDLILLRRVVDCLRALDGWHLPADAAADLVRHARCW
jgi:hypothetical protein